MYTEIKKDCVNTKELKMNEIKKENLNNGM